MRAAPLARAAAVAFAAIVIQFVMVTAYTWPAARLAPRHLPIVVAGPAVPAAAIAAEISRAHPGAFDIIREASAAAARRDLTTHRAYGAIVLSATVPQAPGGTVPQAPGGTVPRAPGGATAPLPASPAPLVPVVMTASAASPIVAQLLTQVASQMSGAKSPVVDAVPISQNDPHGAVFGSLLLPLVITSLIAGVLLTLLIGSALPRLAGLVIFGAGAGLALSAIASSWLAVLPGSYYVIAATTGLITIAVAATVTGLGSIAGRAGRAPAGIGLGAALMLVLGNPLSGATSAMQLLPEPWGQIGQWLPPGAGATLLRAVAYFDGAGAGGSWAVLAAWAGAGLALVALSAAHRPAAARSGATPDHAAAPAITGGLHPSA